jgi:hypothetical protein
MSSISRLGRSLLLVLAVAGVVAPESSAQTMLGRRPGRTAVGRPGAPVNPYSRLFLLPGQKDAATVPRLAGRPPVSVLAATPAPTIVCGTRLVPIDPSVDLGIRRLPDANAPRPSVRAVEPPLCR